MTATVEPNSSGAKAGVRPPRTRRSSAARVLAVGAVAYLVGGLLNAETLRRRAESLPLDSGWRDVALAVTGPLTVVAETLRLTAPGDALDALRGRSDDAGSGSAGRFSLPVVSTAPATGLDSRAAPGAPAIEPSTATTAAPARTGGSAGAGSSGTASAGSPAAGEPAATSPAPTSPAPTAPPPPSAERPLRLYIAGDSMAQGYGQVVQGAATRTGVIAATVDVKVSSGLNRIDFLDWPARLVERVGSLRPDVVIVTFGANDQQPIITEEGRAVRDVSDPAWVAEYTRRVAWAMDFLGGDGRKLIWVGIPNDGRDEVTERLAVIRGVYAAEAAKRPAVTFVDTWTYFESPTGGYAAYVADDEGQVRRMRANDGFHLSIEGANYLGRIVFGEVVKELVARGGQAPG